jgi:hypothetical protein
MEIRLCNLLSFVSYCQFFHVSRIESFPDSCNVYHSLNFDNINEHHIGLELSAVVNFSCSMNCQLCHCLSEARMKKEREE